MDLEVGDKVRTPDGIEGTVVEITDSHIKFESDYLGPYWWDRSLAGLQYKKG